MPNIFAVNKTTANLVFKSGYLTILRGSYSAISAADASSDEFIHAQNRNWVEITDEAPDTINIPAVEAVKAENPIQGMTAEELKASLAEQAPEESKATVSAFGQTESEGPKPATVQALGRDSTVEVNPEETADEAVAETEAAEPVKKAVRKSRTAA